MLNELAFESAVSEARTIQELSGFLPALDDPRLKAREVLFWFPLEGDGPIEDLMGRQRETDGASRAVIAATRYSLASDNPTEGFETLESMRQRHVASIDVKSLVEPKRLRWELHLASAAGALERTVSVTRRLVQFDATPDVVAVAARSLFLLVHPSRPSLDYFVPSAFDPRIHRPEWVLEFTDLFAYILATTVERRGMLRWEDPTTFSASQLEAIVDIEYLLKRIQTSQTSLMPSQQAIQSWCGFAQAAAARDRDKLNEAGRSYTALPAFEVAAGSVLRGSAAASTCFGLAANWSAATDAAQRWTGDAPKDAEAARRLAEAHYKQNEIPEAVEAYEQYVRLREGGDDDWESSLLLHLGLEVNVRRSSAAALEAAAFSAAIRPQAERLISWSYPWFDRLCPKAKERWWVGMFLLTSPHVTDEIGAARFDQAADAFGEAVAFELKQRVFGPFAASTSVGPHDDYWKRALMGRGTLGEMINCLLQIRSTNQAITKQLSKWLSTSLPRVFGYMHTPTSHRLSTMATLRADAQHGWISVTEAQTREVFTEAAAFLEALTGKRE